MNCKSLRLGILVLILGIVSGCSSYRTTSNIKNNFVQSEPSNPNIVIYDHRPPAELNYIEISPIKISISKLSVFHADPTKEQANKALIDQARILGADAVIHVHYTSGIGVLTWGYIDASGIGIKILE